MSLENMTITEVLPGDPDYRAPAEPVPTPPPPAEAVTEIEDAPPAAETALKEQLEKDLRERETSPCRCKRADGGRGRDPACADCGGTGRKKRERRFAPKPRKQPAGAQPSEPAAAPTPAATAPAPTPDPGPKYKCMRCGAVIASPEHWHGDTPYVALPFKADKRTSFPFGALAEGTPPMSVGSPPLCDNLNVHATDPETHPNAVPAPGLVAPAVATPTLPAPTPPTPEAPRTEAEPLVAAAGSVPIPPPGPVEALPSPEPVPVPPTDDQHKALWDLARAHGAACAEAHDSFLTLNMAQTTPALEIPHLRPTDGWLEEAARRQAARESTPEPAPTSPATAFPVATERAPAPLTVADASVCDVADAEERVHGAQGIVERLADALEPTIDAMELDDHEAEDVLSQFARVSAALDQLDAQYQAMRREGERRLAAISWRSGASLEAWARRRIGEKGGRARSVKTLVATAGLRRVPGGPRVEDPAAVERWALAQEDPERFGAYRLVVDRKAIVAHVKATGEEIPGVEDKPEAEVFYVKAGDGRQINVSALRTVPQTDEDPEQIEAPPSAEEE